MDETFQTFVVPRMDDVTLRFKGRLLGESDSHDDPDQKRWTEVNIYVTEKGKYVAQTIGRTTMPDEEVLYRAWLCDTAEQVVDALRRRGALTFVVKDALEQAAERDPAFKDALIEDI